MRGERPKRRDNDEKSGVWDWTSRSISLIAIIISLITAYVTVVRRTDALSLFIKNYPPLVYIDDESGQVGMTYLSQNWSLINSGTGSVAVVAEGISVTDKGSDCLKGSALVFYDTPSLIIKSGEIEIQNLEKIEENSFWSAGKPIGLGNTELLGKEFGHLQVGDAITMCLYFSIVTSANVTSAKWLPLYSTKLAKLDTPMMDMMSSNKSNYDFRKPIPIFYHFGTIFQ